MPRHILRCFNTDMNNTFSNPFPDLFTPGIVASTRRVRWKFRIGCCPSRRAPGCGQRCQYATRWCSYKPHDYIYQYYIVRIKRWLCYNISESVLLHRNEPTLRMKHKRNGPPTRRVQSGYKVETRRGGRETDVRRIYMR